MYNKSNMEVNIIEAVEPRPADPYATEFPSLKEFIDKIKAPGKKLRVCIATEDIVGPINNGGIGTTYTHLSRLLAENGHKVVIAYLRGSYCQNKSIHHWIDWYKQFGVVFQPVDPDDFQINCSAPQWTKPMYALYQYLKQENFDLVHVSEWRGSAFLSLVAKKQGLAFKKTMFCVKASSPWLWNREHGYQIINRLDELPKIFAEKGSIELADMVIGGSRHLLRWMIEHGYKLSEGNCYVQPNVMFPLDLDSLAKERRKFVGKRMKIDEIVFFGRLEYRKGLDIFFDAMDRLFAKKLKVPKITFLGKYGEKIPSYPELSCSEYIEKLSGKWPVDVQVISNYESEKALGYLLSGNRLAVMPSRIENSTLAVYETAYYGIPCIASDRGGTSELIEPLHCENVLTEPNPAALADKIEEAVSIGGFVPKPSFDNDENISEWIRFHDAMGNHIQNIEKNMSIKDNKICPKISICFAVCDDLEYMEELFTRIEDLIDGSDCELVISNNLAENNETTIWLEKVKKALGSACTVIKGDGIGEQAAQSHAAMNAKGDLLVFFERGTLLKPEFIRVLQTVASSSSASVFGSFYDRVWHVKDINEGKSILHAASMGDYSSGFYGLDDFSPVIAIQRDVFQKLDGLSNDYKIPGALKEFFNKAVLNNFKVETIPEPIVWYVAKFDSFKRLNYGAEPFRTIRPFLDNAPQCYKRILMAARSMSGGNSSGSTGQISGPINYLEGQARMVADDAGSSPLLKGFGFKIYYFNISVFRKILQLEIKIFRLLLSIKNKLRKSS